MAFAAKSLFSLSILFFNFELCFIGGDWTGGVRDDIRSGT